MAGNVNVTYQEMEDAGRRLQSGKQDLDAKLQELQKLVTSLVNGGFVTDRASKEFDQSYNEFTTGASKTLDGLDGMAQYLQKAADAFRSVDNELSAALKK